MGVAPAHKTTHPARVALPDIPRKLRIPRVKHPPIFGHAPAELRAAASEALNVSGPDGKQPVAGPLALATKPEWYVYWALTEKFKKVDNVDFTYRDEVQFLPSLSIQTQLDFVFLDGSFLAFEIQGTRWHYEMGTDKIVADAFRRALVAAQGYQIIFLDEDQITVDTSGSAVTALVGDALRGIDRSYQTTYFVRA